MRFDNSINLGHILTIVTLVGGMVAAYTTYRVTITQHDARIIRLEELSKAQAATNSEMTGHMFSIKQDLGVIKFRLEREKDPR